MRSAIRIIKRRVLPAGAWLGLSALAALAVRAAPPLESAPPPVVREFRGLWVATVNNIDWPSRPGLASRQQQQELIALLDRAAALHLNAIIFQVRSDCDALYPSSLEPWSEYLTGRMGQAPSPYYDPLAFAVAEAHRRGLELHAWFNPFRVRHGDARSPASSLHVSVKHPEWVRGYGKSLWLDPADPAARAYSLSVILDVVRRYDIDGVHFDDYFYPYPEKSEKSPGAPDIEFSDEASWRHSLAEGGKLSRGDWRRENIDEFIRAVALAVKKEKPWVQFGVSPFGIWRPGNPPPISGFDSYDKLFGDSRKWLAQGWLDYCAPQLYWPIDQKAHSFATLLKWWCAQNNRRRTLCPGMRIDVTNGVREAVREIELTRAQSGASGEILWHARSLMRDEGGLVNALETQVYSSPALTPARPWLQGEVPAEPVLRVFPGRHELVLNWKSTNAPVCRWVLQKRTAGKWATLIFAGAKTSETIAAAAGGILPDTVALSAVNQFGEISRPVIVRGQQQNLQEALPISPH